MDELSWGGGSAPRPRRAARRTAGDGRVYGLTGYLRAIAVDPDLPGRGAALGRLGAAGLALAGVALVAASQLLPWGHAITQGVDVNDAGFSNQVRHRVALSMVDGQALVSIPYYILLLASLALVGACLFAPPRSGRVLTGGALGALMAQGLVLLPIVAKPARLAADGAAQYLGVLRTLSVSHGAGLWCAALAIVALALAVLAMAVSRTLSGDERDAHQSPAAPRAMTASDDPGTGTGETGTDDVESARVAMNMFTVESHDTLPDDDAAASDHSLYQRPHAVDFSKH